MLSILPSAIALGMAGIVALFLTLSRRWADFDTEHLRYAVLIAAGTTGIQAIHFSEELHGGFHEQFPGVFGFPPMTLAFFVSFNVAWLGIWALSTWGLARRRHVALFPLWFLGVAGVANGLLLAVSVAGYFPGLATSLLIAAVGALLLARLVHLDLGAARHWQGVCSPLGHDRGKDAIMSCRC